MAQGDRMSVDDLVDVQRKLYAVRNEWYNLGLELGLRAPTLDSIAAKYNNDPSQCFCQVLKEWLKGVNPPPTWQVIMTALKSPTVAQWHLAEQIQSELLPALSTQPLVPQHLSPQPQSPQPPSTSTQPHPKSLDRLTSSLEAVPLTPLSLPSSAGANTPNVCPGVEELPSQPPKNQLKGAQVQSLSLEEEIKQFEDKYADLVVSVRNAFKREGVSFEKVQISLLQLPVSLKQYAKLLQNEASLLARASNIDELFFILSPHWDFLNPNLLTHLAYRFGDEQTIRLVDKYLGELREFRMQTKISDFIDKWTGTPLPDTQEIVMELQDNLGEQSLEQLETLRNKVSRKRCLEDYVMPLKTIKVSSVDAVFSLPKSLDIPSLQLESLREFFREHQVLRILLNGVCILNLQLQQPPPVTHVKSMHSEGDDEMEEQLPVPHMKPMYSSTDTSFGMEEPPPVKRMRTMKKQLPARSPANEFGMEEMHPQRELQTPLKFRKAKGILWGISLYPKTVQLHNNLYLGGGHSEHSDSNRIDSIVLCYDTVTDTWSRLPEYECFFFGMSVVNGHLTLVGGVDRDTGSYSGKVGVWNPSSQCWMQPYPPMNTPRRSPEVATYNNYLLAAGGYNGRVLTTVEVLDVRASQQWLTATQLPVPCFLTTSAILHDNWYVITARKQMMYTSLPELCTIPRTVTKSITTTTPTRCWHLLHTPLESSTAIAFRGSLLAVGGVHNNTPSRAIHLHHPEKNTWTEVGELPTPRYSCSVTVLPSGKLLISGGRDQQDKLTTHSTLVDIATIMD